jgi:hypothetical protein
MLHKAATGLAHFISREALCAELQGALVRPAQAP